MSSQAPAIKPQGSGKQALVLTPEEVELVKKQFFPPGTSDLEFKYCMSVAHNLGLNPITKEIHFVRRKVKLPNGQWVEKVEPLVGRDGYLTIAHRSGHFDGMTTTSCIKKVPRRMANGEFQYIDDLVATSTVYSKVLNHPVVVEVAFHEYVGKANDGKITKMWDEKGDTMIKKVADSQGLRKAFNINGVYAAEEIGVGEINADGNLVIDVGACDAVVGQAMQPQQNGSTGSESQLQQETEPKVNAAQVKALLKALKDGNVDEGIILTKLEYTALEEIPATRFQEALKLICDSKVPPQDTQKTSRESTVVNLGQVKTLQALIKKLGANIDLPAMLKHFNIEKLEDLPAANFEYLKESLNKKLANLQQQAA